ncbi:hypothetical protein [Enterovirga sp. CN4-39]|uniref:hypothetical protein n=1 Tax=Enterovirga sp. CN4-39 TaxID=3400910 RepID=UPI003BFB87DB
MGGEELWPGFWFAPAAASELEAALRPTDAYHIRHVDASVGRFMLSAAAGHRCRRLFEERIAPHIIDLTKIRATFCNMGEVFFASTLRRYQAEVERSSTLDDLSLLLMRHGSDKGAGWHNYARLYAEIFRRHRKPVSNLMEIGLGTNNISIPSNMGKDGVPGASLRAWREYFPSATVYGADIDRGILFTEDRIRTFFVDQTDRSSFDDLWRAIGPITFDIFIDDGLHTLDAARLTFESSIGRLEHDGVYIIEDIPLAQSDDYLAFVRNSGHAAVLVELPHAVNDVDNALILVTRRPGC